MSGFPEFERRPPALLPPLGCLAIALSLLLFCLMPFLLIDLMQTALSRLHLPGPIAGIALVLIFVGSMINIPLYRIPRNELQPEIVMGPFGWRMISPQYRLVRRESIVAVNVGGCVVPTLLALWQIFHLTRLGTAPMVGLFVACMTNIMVCYLIARPVPGFGIIMPAFVSPLVAVGVTWIVCGLFAPVGVENLAPIAFTAGVAGPLIGADLLHLKDLLRTPVGVMSIGGAGTFDGIVFSAVLAALLA